MPFTSSTGRSAAVALCGVFAALTAICSQISIPLPFTPVPINLATLSVFLAGSLLGARLGTLSQFVYVFLGFLGLPVFSQFSGGPAIVLGPTGGYIIGYIIAAFIAGILVRTCNRAAALRTARGQSPAALQMVAVPLSLAAALFACYLLGTLWFMHLTAAPLPVALVKCVFPFLPGDALKILLASWLIARLQPVCRKLIP